MSIERFLQKKLLGCTELGSEKGDGLRCSSELVVLLGKCGTPCALSVLIWSNNVGTVGLNPQQGLSHCVCLFVCMRASVWLCSH